MVYAVIDTNVLVSAIFAAHQDSATVIVREKIMDGTIVPLYNAEIFDEYRDVLTRPKFHFPAELVDAVLDVILQKGLSLERTKSEEVFTDPKDVVFYEIALSPTFSTSVKKAATPILRVEMFALLCIYSTAFASHEDRNSS